ncbi:Cystathionine beta-lyase, chloroplastic, partial [Linum perenne]
SGDEIVAGDDIYGGSDRLLSQVIPKSGILVKRVNTSSLDDVASAIGPQTKLVWLESPTNPRQQISDIRPLELGADIVMQSATKFIAGHSDVMAGALVENAQKIAEFLGSHPRVTRVNYAGLPGHPGRELHYSQAEGAGSVFSFLTGSVKSLISMPCFMSHASIPAAVREARGLTEDLIRISVGIEDVDDLIADLDLALKTGPP